MELSQLKLHADEPARRGEVLNGSMVGVAWLRDVPVDDRYRVAAEIVRGADEADVLRVPRLADWLVRDGVDDVGRLRRWAEDMVDIGGDPSGSRGFEFAHQLCKEVATLARDRAGRRPSPVPTGRGDRV